MNASIDRDACTGCELCAKECSEVFQIAGGKATVDVKPVPEALEATCRHTVRECPAGAIYIGEARGLMLSGRDGARPQWIAL